MAVAIDHQVLDSDSESDMIAAVVIESFDDYPIVEVSEMAVPHVLESHQLNRSLSMDVLQLDSMAVVQQDFVVQIVVSVPMSAIELNPIR